MALIEIDKSKLGDFKSAEALKVASDRSLVINNVFGINKEGALPARFLSGFLSTFSLARTIQEVSSGELSPQVRIFRPVNGIKYLNGIPEEIANRQVVQGNRILEQLALRHFPTVDFFIEDDTPITDEALDVLSEIEGLISLHCDEETKGKLMKSGRARGGEQGAQNMLTYAALHPFGWSDLYHSSIFRRLPPEVVINTLPPSEKRFTEVRKRLMQVIGDSAKALVVPVEIREELVINMCGTPHYISLEDGQGNRQEPTLDELLSVSCAEILNDMKLRSKSEQNPFLEENLRRAHRDLEKVFLLFAKGNSKVLSEITFEELLKS